MFDLKEVICLWVTNVYTRISPLVPLWTFQVHPFKFAVAMGEPPIGFTGPRFPSLRVLFSQPIVSFGKWFVILPDHDLVVSAADRMVWI